MEKGVGRSSSDDLEAPVLVRRRDQDCVYDMHHAVRREDVGIYTLDGDRKKGRSLLRRTRRGTGFLRERVVLAADEAAALGRVRRDPGAVLLVVALLVPRAGVRAGRAAGGRAAVPGADVVLALDVRARRRLCRTILRSRIGSSG